MLGSYLKMTLRTLRKQKGYTFINIVGLAVGIAVCALILLWVRDELRYDRFHEMSGAYTPAGSSPKQVAPYF